jgi:hypothetical protein
MEQDIRCEQCGATFTNEQLRDQHMQSAHRSASPAGFPSDRERGGEGMEPGGGTSGMTSSPAGGARGGAGPEAVAEGLTEGYSGQGSDRPTAETPGASGERYYTSPEGRFASGGDGEPGHTSTGTADNTEATPGSFGAENAGASAEARQGSSIGGGMEGEGLRGTDMESGETEEEPRQREGSRSGEGGSSHRG